MEQLFENIPILDIDESIIPVTTTWTLSDLKNHINSPSNLPDPEQMPSQIDIGQNMIWDIQNKLAKSNEEFRLETRDIFRKTKYHKNEIALEPGKPIRLLSYSDDGVYVGEEPISSSPPPFEFLMPILNYNRVRQGVAQGMFFASMDSILLALRTNKSMVLADKAVEPAQSHYMQIPPCRMPHPEREGLAVTVRKTKEEVKMLKFLEKCAYADIAIYGRKTYPNRTEEVQKTVLTKMDWNDII